MGKETELWNDSALIHAFENAMSKYKVMHSTPYQGNHPEDSTTDEGNHPEEEEVVNGINENRPTISFETKMQVEADEPSQIQEMGAANESSPIQERNPIPESYTLEPSMDSSSGPPIQETFEKNFNLQGSQYNLLLGQYYELEEQRQKVLQQLYQASYWNYQSSGEGPSSSEPWNPCCSTSQAHCTSHPALLSSCCLYSSPCLAAPCPSVPVCCFGAQYPAKIGTNVTANALADDRVVQTSMGAAERALYSTRMKVSEISKSCEEKEKGLAESAVSKNINSETDLTEVLSAWYSAGFHTGKYLSEQSIKKGRP